MQNNLTSQKQENGELMCLLEVMMWSPRQWQVSGHQKDKWVLIDYSGTPWIQLYSYFYLSPMNITLAKEFKKQGEKGKLSLGCGVHSMLNFF